MLSVRDRKSVCILVVWCLSMLSLQTDEAFVAARLPDLETDIKDFQVFRWNLKHWSTLSQKITSPEFECGGHKWCV